MKDKTIIYKGNIDEIADYYCDLFRGYADIKEDAKKEAIRDWAKRCFLGNGLYRFAFAQYISKSAKEYLESLPVSQLNIKGYQMEHIVPKSSGGLKSIIEVASDNTLSEAEKDERIRTIVKTEMLVCFVTDEENEKLNKVCKNDMPNKFSREKGNFFIRYEEAFGMNEKELMENFFVKISTIQIHDNKLKIN
ncbi:MAG: hypothetical protein J5747_12495 [Spirochaetaceae bacterium]|nr:hypothetical protein [Spirochaetaceae bacterium]